MEKILNRAKQAGKPIEIIYQGCDGCITQRMIVVKRITVTRVLAYCTMRKQYRQFEISRILAVGTGREERTTAKIH